MPSEVLDAERFIRLAEAARECRVKRVEDVVKLKIRTPGKLYTLKLDVEKAQEVLKQIKCPIVEV